MATSGGGQPTALAFDMYGTLVDPIRIWERLEEHVPAGEALGIARTWRQKQLEYTFRLTAMERYEDFRWVTTKALDHALAEAGVDLGRHDRESLVAQYDDLEPFPDVHEGLARLRAAGHPMVVFSNGTPAMLRSLMAAARLRPLLDDVVSVDEVRTYKPSPRVYRHVAERLGRPVHQVCLVSSNPFDDIGAEAVGMQAVWVDRSGGLFDTLAPPPRLRAASLTELADTLAASPG